MPDDSKLFQVSPASNGGQQHKPPGVHVDSDRIVAVLDKATEALLALAEQQKSLTLTLQAVATSAQICLNISAKVQRDLAEMLGAKESE